MKFIFSYFIFGPFLAALVLLLGGRKLGVRGCYFVSFFMAMSSITSIFYFFKTFQHPGGSLIYRFNYGSWFEVGELQASWGFIFDGLSLIMGTLVVTVSTVTQFYSYWYLKTESALIRFQAYLQLFTFFMLVLVFADNFALFFLGWEGIGLCSFLLIGFWFSRQEARIAAIKAVAVNRIGDSAFLAAVGLLTSLSGSLNFSTNFMLGYLYEPVTVSTGLTCDVYLLNIINSFFLIAVCAKSAQLGLHTWLADAMEGPTPVSALIHAATMVTAGIYLVLRCSPIFELTPDVSNAMALVGAYTAFFGASCACFQWDIKKVIAYSTCSQLGYMLCACGLGGYTLAFYHLITHGFFKALLFLASGVLIHQLNGEQDMRRMGGLLPMLPLTFSYFLIGFSALVGLPGTSGFFSKERILDFCSVCGTNVGIICYSLLWLALVCTAFYTVRTIHYIFFGTYRGSRSVWVMVSNQSHVETTPQVRWALSALIFFIFFSEELLNFYTGAVNGLFLQTGIITTKTNHYVLFAESLASSNRLLPITAIGLGIASFWSTEIIDLEWGSKAFFSPKASMIFDFIRFWQQGWYVDLLLNHVCFSIFNPLTRISFAMEKGVFEWFGPFGLDRLLLALYLRLDTLNVQRSIFSSVSLLINIYSVILFCVFYIYLFYNSYKL